MRVHNVRIYLKIFDLCPYPVINIAQGKFHAMREYPFTLILRTTCFLCIRIFISDEHIIRARRHDARMKSISENVYFGKVDKRRIF